MAVAIGGGFVPFKRFFVRVCLSVCTGHSNPDTRPPPRGGEGVRMVRMVLGVKLASILLACTVEVVSYLLDPAILSHKVSHLFSEGG